MDRREFIGGTLASTLTADKAATPQATSAAGPKDVTAGGEVLIQRPQSGKPHAGKVLATIAPHSDDHPIFAGGTVPN